jgi:hypothetical protein
MSLALIEESAKEVRRLAIAGSPLAIGDFRLKKLIAPLEQAGAKVPVFAQVAKGMTELVNGTEAESTTRLLSLSTLLNAILYTQGQTSTNGDFQKLETFPTRCTTTRTTARVLKPLIEALTSSGAGRFETIKSAIERGAFNDLRLIDPAICALGDNYPELADLVAEKILPGYGPGIVPRLKSTFEIRGKKSDARKLEVMHRLDGAGTLELCRKALEDGSVEVKVAAIGCLGQHEDCLPLVFEQANAKNKQLRAAALEALAVHDRPEVVKIFTDLIKGKAFDILARPFRALRNRQVLNSLLEEGEAIYQAVLKGDSEQIPRFWEVLDCLDGRSDSDVEEFLLGRFENARKLTKVKAAKDSVLAGAELMTRIAGLLYSIGSPRALEAVLAQRGILPTAAFPQVLHSALRTWPPDKVFTEFSPLLDVTKGAGKEKVQHLQHAISAAHWDETSRFNPMAYIDPDDSNDQLLRKHAWDARWLDAAIKADQAAIVCCLARPNHKAVLDYLLKLGDAKKSIDGGMIVRALARCQYSKITDCFLELIARKTKNAKYLDYELQSLFENARHLPPADLAKLEAFAAKLDEKFVDQYLEALAPLRPVKAQESGRSD